MGRVPEPEEVPPSAGAESPQLRAFLDGLSLPGRVLALGANMDEPILELHRELHDTDLTALVSRFEPAAPAPDVTGARDWSVFDERLHYIAHLFRAFHLHEELLCPAFTQRRCRRFRPGRSPTARCRSSRPGRPRGRAGTADPPPAVHGDEALRRPV